MNEKITYSPALKDFKNLAAEILNTQCKGQRAFGGSPGKSTWDSHQERGIMLWKCRK